MVPSKKKIFFEKKQVRDMTNTKHELKRKQLKYKAVDYQETIYAKQQRRTIQNNRHC